jgi:hypothetical protein
MAEIPMGIEEMNVKSPNIILRRQIQNKAACPIDRALDLHFEELVSNLCRNTG